MPTDMEPTVGQWYYDAEGDRWLEVVDVDFDEELVVVQSQEGEEDELSLDAWYGLDVEPGEPPDEDWLGGAEDLDEDEVELEDDSDDDLDEEFEGDRTAKRRPEDDSYSEEWDEDS